MVERERSLCRERLLTYCFSKVVIDRGMLRSNVIDPAYDRVPLQPLSHCGRGRMFLRRILGASDYTELNRSPRSSGLSCRYAQGIAWFLSSLYFELDTRHSVKIPSRGDHRGIETLWSDMGWEHWSFAPVFTLSATVTSSAGYPLISLFCRLRSGRRVKLILCASCDPGVEGVNHEK